MISETRGRVWEWGHPGVKTDKFFLILLISGKSGVKYVRTHAFNLFYEYKDLITSLT